ncbi:MAG: hypothetical protein Q3971_09615 [Moraxella sp.]|nr:hypothetical protein [Moraxella sp.]
MLGGGQNSTQTQAPQAQNAYLQSYGQIPQGQGGQWGNTPPQGQQRPIGMTSSLYQPMQSAPQPITPPTPPMGQGGRVPDEDVPF